MTYSIDDFILSLFAHGNKARASTLYQLLKGKRTISIISYGFLYDVLQYFALFPQLPEYQFNQIIEKLLRAQWLVERDDKVVLTSAGKKHLADHGLNVSIDHLNSFKHYRHDQRFKALLLFIVQVVSELSYKNSQYVPIELNAFQQMQVKQWLVTQLANKTKEEVITEFSDELTELLSQLNDESSQAPLFFGQLAGHELPGQTLAQLSDSLGVSSLETILLDRATIHLIIETLYAQPERLPLVNSILQLVARYPYNQSALKSYELFKATFDVALVMKERHIKQSTLDEHLLEFAIIDEAFPYDFFLKPVLLDEFKHLNQLFPNEKEWLFNVIEKNSQVPITYFDMRLYQIYKKREG